MVFLRSPNSFAQETPSSRSPCFFPFSIYNSILLLCVIHWTYRSRHVRVQHVMVKYGPNLSHLPLSLCVSKINLTPPHIMIILSLFPPPPFLEKSLLPLIPLYLVYLLDFFLRYEHHFKWLFDIFLFHWITLECYFWNFWFKFPVLLYQCKESALF